MRATLGKLELKNYRSCIRTKFDFNVSLSAMIGPNGAGKTNVMHGILLLRKLFRSEREHRSDTGAHSACGLNATFRVGREQFVQFRAKVRYTTNERNADELAASEQEWNLGPNLGSDEWIRLPFLTFPWTAAFRRRSDHGYRFLSPLRISSKGTRHFDREFMNLMSHQTVSLRDFYLAEELEKDFVIREPRQVQKAAAAIKELVSGMTYYSASQFTDPSRAPIYFELEEGSKIRHFGRGREHTPFLHGMYSMWKEDKAQFSEFMSIVGQDGVGLISNVDFTEVETPANVFDVQVGGKISRKESKRILVIPVITIGRSTLSPNQLSEGTFKTLALIYHLLTDRSQLLLIEEPEVCVHHGLLESVIELIKRESKRKQIVISTHSDFVLDALEPENVFLARRDAKRGTLVRPVPSALSKRRFEGLREYLGSSGNLGEFWRHGGLE